MSRQKSQAADQGTLSHFDRDGRARMVDVGEKPETERVAVASGRVRMAGETVDLIRAGRAAKGDVLAVAQVAAVMGAKRTADLIPMCHPLMLTRIDVSFELRQEEVRVEATVATRGRTGVEMEALTAVATAALTIYDMLKAADRGMTIEGIQLESKVGGRSGAWNRDGETAPTIAANEAN
ncbi:MAG TPA: cyclic pyranopterin monophosphate synthase MoaC [Thermomicrobiales bacterium]|nr:cyclic pyranopterin monophosphate synthase MoaC [Thermomicrobiales bacterium]